MVPQPAGPLIGGSVSSLPLLVAVLMVLVVVLAVGQLVDLAHRYPTAATPMLVGLGGMTVVVPIVVG